jgi:hypothetical protein
MDKSYQVYLIEDINDLRYYGMTCAPLSIRFSNHLSAYRNLYGKCSSCKLNLYNSVISCLENNLTEKEAIELEKYYIRNNECVNEIKYKDDAKKTKHEYYIRTREKNKEILKEYREKNKDKIRERRKQYREKNKEILKEKKKQYHQKNKELLTKKTKEWVENNKEKSNEWKQTIWKCDICNCNMKLPNKARHLKTEKHINNSLK